MTTIPFDYLAALAAWSSERPLLIVGAGRRALDLALAIRVRGLGPAFRAPHHTIGHKAFRLELELARGGILLLDDAPQFDPRNLDAVRRALQTPRITGIGRVRILLTVPCETFASRRSRRRLRQLAPFAGVIRIRERGAR